MSQATLREAFRLLDSGRFAAAESLFQQVSELADVWQADAQNGLGLCAEARQQLDVAESCYRQALQQKPAEPEYLNNLAICLIRRGQTDQGLAVFERLIQLNPPPEARFNLVLALAAADQLSAALKALATLLSHFPQQQAPLAWLLAQASQDPEGRLFGILQLLHQQDPEEPVFLFGLAIAYQAQGQNPLALRYLRAALRNRPALQGAYQPLIQLLRSEGLYREALVLVNQHLAADSSLPAVVERVITLAQPVPASEADIQQTYQTLLQTLQNFVPAERQVPWLPQILSFYLVYQLGDVRVLQEQLAAFFACFLSWNPPGVAAVPQAPARRKPRLGIVSAYFFRHSVTDLLLRALEVLLDSPDFETWLYFYPVAGQPDQVTAHLQQQADHFVMLSDALPEALEQLASAQLDLLIYTDLGMEPLTYVLALNRLARHQLVLPGHPVTTGMASMDYFVSGQALEPPQGQDFYSETLVRLPGLPDYQRPLLPPVASRQELGLPEGHLYFCPMTLFKIQPAFDTVMARILSLDPEARVLLLEYKNQLHLQLQQRFAARFPDLAGRLVFLPWSSQDVFFQRLLAVDVMLDSFPFGGGNTSYQALGLGCPIVCLDVPWQKGRWTQAMYHLMGIEGLVAADTEDYAQLAVRVARDKAWQATLREQIRERSGVLFDNPTWSRALLDFCLQLRSASPDRMPG